MSRRFPLLALLTASLRPAGRTCPGRAARRTWPGLERLGIRRRLARGRCRSTAGSVAAAAPIITFLGHSSYQIDTPQGVRAITDYNGVNGFGRKPDIVTMNNAHSTHFTDEPEEGITYVLRGWPLKPGETEAKHDVQLKDMKVWNVPTNARDWGGNSARINGNSIFIYAIADLCIAHLGHLHHRLTKEHLDELGRIDVLMVPIDGAYTMGMPLMVDVIKQVQPKIVLPMHYWGRAQVNRFESLMSEARRRLRLARPAHHRGRARGAAREAHRHGGRRQRRGLSLGVHLARWDLVPDGEPIEDHLRPCCCRCATTACPPC